MFIVAMVGILLGMLIVIIRALSVHGLYDRLLAVNTFGTLSVLFIAVFGFMIGRTDFLDIALLYALINFIITVGILKFCKYSSMNNNDRDVSEHSP